LKHDLEEPLEENIMRVADVMTHGVECARPLDTVDRVASRMRDLNVGSLPVCGDDERLEGIVTDRDITVRAVSSGSDPRGTRIRDVMTPTLVYCFDDQDISEAVELMEEHQIRRLIVLDRNKRLVGIVSLGDLAVRTGDDRLSGEALEQVSEPAEPRR
jgi:CBS domain-containing protein